MESRILHAVRRTLVLSVCCGAVALIPLAFLADLSAAPRKPVPKGALQADSDTPGSTEEGAADEQESSEQGETQISLNYFKSSWKKVLKDVAEAMQTDLVAEKIPAKSFSRMDRRTHTPEEALRILNQTLEPEGFRLRKMGKHLVLMEIRKTRQEYPRSVVPAAKPADYETDAGEEAAPVADVVPRRLKRKPVPRDAESEITTADHVAPRPARRTAVTHVSAEEDAPPEKEAAPEPEAPTVESVRLRARDAVSVARIVFKAFKTQAEFVTDGPQNLQGFRVFYEADPKANQDDPQHRKVRFTIGIDKKENELVVEALPRDTKVLVRLIKSLDILPKTEESTVRAVQTSKDAGQIANALQPELDRLIAASGKGAVKAQQSALEQLREEPKASQDEEDPPQQIKKPAAPKGGMPQGGDNATTPESLIGSLKGDVSVEAVPDLGILIIRGNEKDVDAVTSVIREIEKLSISSVPNVELLMLKHVNSEGLAVLLTTVYERLASARSRGLPTGQGVTVLPVVRPNAVLILASAADMKGVINLAEELDQPFDPATEFRVIRLKHAIPSQVVDAVEDMYPAPTQATGQQQLVLGMAPRVRIFADVRTNSVVVQARPRDLKEIEALIKSLDVSESGSVNQLKIFQLKNAVADEMANTLSSAIQSVLNPARVAAVAGAAAALGAQQGAAGQASPELRAIKSTILQLLDSRGNQERLVQSGILSDIRITADVRTNSLVVLAPEGSMELLGRLIETLDTPAAAVAEIKVFSLANGDASSMVQLLERLFSTSANQRPGQNGQGGQGGQLGGGLQVAGSDDASSTLIPLRFSVDVRTNSIIAIGGSEALRVVEAVLLRLDESDIRQRQNLVYRLSNSPAADIAAAISSFLQTQRNVEQVDPGLVSPFEQIEREVVVVPEPVSNSLLISATPRYFKDIEQLVIKLDRAPQQVVIDALLVEVSLNNTDEFGMELGLQDSILFQRSLINQLVQLTTTTTQLGVQTTSNQIISQSSTPGYSFNNQPLGNNTSPTVNSSYVGSQGLTNLSLGRVDNNLGYGGLVLSAGSENVSFLLRALAARRRVDILSRPLITTLDNQLAQIQVGQEIPRISGFTSNGTTGVNTPTVQQRSIGIILAVTPRISPEGNVVMVVSARKDSLNPAGVPLVTNADGTVITSPIIDTTNALSTVSVRSGQTIVLGGMITKSDAVEQRKVPYLGDIPILGRFFRYDYKNTTKTELLIFLTPRIAHNEFEAEQIKEIEAQRSSFIEEEAEAIHGPLFGIPDGEPDWIRGHGSVDPSAPNILPPPTIVPPAPANPQTPFDESKVPTTILPGKEPIPMPPAAQDPKDPKVGLKRLQKSSKIVRDAEVAPAGYQSTAPEATPAAGRPGKASKAAEAKPAKPKKPTKKEIWNSMDANARKPPRVPVGQREQEEE